MSTLQSCAAGFMVTYEVDGRAASSMAPQGNGHRPIARSHHIRPYFLLPLDFKDKRNWRECGREAGKLGSSSAVIPTAFPPPIPWRSTLLVWHSTRNSLKPCRSIWLHGDPHAGRANRRCPTRLRLARSAVGLIGPPWQKGSATLGGRRAGNDRYLLLSPPSKAWAARVDRGCKSFKARASDRTKSGVKSGGGVDASRWAMSMGLYATTV